MRVVVEGCDAFVATADREVRAGEPAVVFLHGAGQDHTLWRLQVRALAADGWNACAPDLPGHGLSGGEPIESVEAMAAWVAEFLTRSGLGPIVVAGHSMGALTGLQLAIDRPDLVAGLVLTGAAAAMPVHEQLLELAGEGDAQAVELVVGWVHTGAGRMGTSAQPGLWEPGITRRLMGRSVAALAGDLEACNRHRFASLEGVTCPVVVVSGQLDRMTSLRSASALVDSLPHATLIEVPGVGHDIVSRAHRVVTEAVRGHARSTLE